MTCAEAIERWLAADPHSRVPRSRSTAVLSDEIRMRRMIEKLRKEKAA